MTLPPGTAAVLLAAAVLLVAASILILRGAGRLRRRSGLPAGRIVFSDTGDWRPPDAPLFSNTYRISGKPDYLVATRQGTIPVEIKSGSAPDSPYDSHLLQLAAYCLLVEDDLGRPAPYGLVRYADGTVFRVDFTPQLRQTALNTLAEMRRALAAANQAGPERNHDQPARCAGCGYRDVCDRALL